MRCCATFCDQILRPGVPWFDFPLVTDAIRCHIWQKRLHLDVSTVKKLRETPGGLRVCYLHFSPKQLVYSTKVKKLVREALPDRNIILDDSFISNACRFCLETGGTEEVRIFSTISGESSTLAQDFKEVFGVEVSAEDGLPQHVCLTCMTKLKYMKRVRDQFHANNSKLQAIASGIPHLLKSETDCLGNSIPMPENAQKSVQTNRDHPATKSVSSDKVDRKLPPSSSESPFKKLRRYSAARRHAVSNSTDNSADSEIKTEPPDAAAPPVVMEVSAFDTEQEEELIELLIVNSSSPTKDIDNTLDDEDDDSIECIDLVKQEAEESYSSSAVKN